jgi:transcriptional regulator of arginine metabolism
MTASLQRRDAILRIIREDEVHSQEQLLGLLGRRGFVVTQPTLSRDLRELGLVKTPGGYVAPEDIAPANVAQFAPSERREERLEQLVREFVVSVERGGTMVVIKTPPADAQPVARALDEAGLPGILGTVAGDDTIFIAVRTVKIASALVRRFTGLLSASYPRRRRA